MQGLAAGIHQKQPQSLQIGHKRQRIDRRRQVAHPHFAAQSHLGAGIETPGRQHANHRLPQLPLRIGRIHALPQAHPQPRSHVHIGGIAHHQLGVRRAALTQMALHRGQLIGRRAGGKQVAGHLRPQIGDHHHLHRLA
ncbi:MAG: hypothetical protein ACK56F_25835, partial [bacterium]